ncbi:hypothetical protein [Novosphingobium sp.]|uniref:hypothetical protein n=1 Tax=Novosphingobium sp. TaxID=1874826 RepID=UPI002FE02594
MKKQAALLSHRFSGAAAFSNQMMAAAIAPFKPMSRGKAGSEVRVTEADMQTTQLTTEDDGDHRQRFAEFSLASSEIYPIEWIG